MTTETLTMWGNGAVTLPKEWRTQFPTRHFVAMEVPQGLLIRPILDVESYRERDGTVGLRFPSGMDMEEFLSLYRKADAKISAAAKGKRPGRRTSSKA